MYLWLLHGCFGIRDNTPANILVPQLWGLVTPFGRTVEGWLGSSAVLPHQAALRKVSGAAACPHTPRARSSQDGVASRSSLVPGRCAVAALRDLPRKSGYRQQGQRPLHVCYGFRSSLASAPSGLALVWLRVVSLCWRRPFVARAHFRVAFEPSWIASQRVSGLPWGRRCLCEERELWLQRLRKRRSSCQRVARVKNSKEKENVLRFVPFFSLIYGVSHHFC